MIISINLQSPDQLNLQHSITNLNITTNLLNNTKTKGSQQLQQIIPSKIIREGLPKIMTKINTKATSNKTTVTGAEAIK